MMCLCIAVLCMGILAASSATYNINGNISYNMIDGVALVNTRVYKVAGTTTETDLSTKCTELSSKSFEEIERISDPYYILSQKLDSQPLIDTSSEETSSSSTTSVDIVYGAVDSGVEYYTYYIVIEIKNVSADTGYVLNAYLDKLEKSTISNIVSNANGSSNIVEIKSGKYSNIVIGLSYTDTTKTAETFNYTLNVSYVEKIFAFADVELKQDTKNKYWYVELGNVSADTDATKLKWRYVGDYSTSSDGTETFTRYDSTTTPTVGSGSVFVQETALADLWEEWGKRPNYFDQCDFRESVRQGTLFSLTNDEQTYLTNGYIEARTLPDLDWSYYGEDSNNSTSFSYPYTDDSHSKLTSNSKGTDYFWLMSVDEIYKYFKCSVDSISEPSGTCHSEFVWSALLDSGETYWLRSPSYMGADEVTTVHSDGCFGYANPDWSLVIRAAFRLK